MKSNLFCIIPLAVYAIVNIFVSDLFWPHFVVLLLSFLVFQLARLRYPKDSVPPAAKVSQAAFYILTVAIIFRDQFLSPLIVTILLGITVGLVIMEIIQYRKQAR